jgi:hypothetical protein
MYFISKLYQFIQYQKNEYYQIVQNKKKEQYKKQVYTTQDLIKIDNPIYIISKNTLKQY